MSMCAPRAPHEGHPKDAGRLARGAVAEVWKLTVEVLAPLICTIWAFFGAGAPQEDASKSGELVFLPKLEADEKLRIKTRV